MKQKFILWLSLLAVFTLMLHSCVHDEVYSSSDPSAKEYENKSLWKEDEKYITNVMKIYREHENEIKRTGGTPYWDYATTMDSYDERFLMVPVVENRKVVSVLKVPRHGSKVYFYYTQAKDDLDFFQALVFAKYKKTKEDDMNAEMSRIECKRVWRYIWLPNDQNNPDSGDGEWYGVSSVICKEVMDQCVGVINEFGECDTSGGGDGGGFEYPGGGGNPETPEKTPCEKAKDVYNDLAVKSRYDVLKTKVSAPNETGYGFKTVPGPNGAAAVQTTPLNPDTMSADRMKVSISSTTFGYSHTHLNKSNDQVTVKIFSPKDINTFLEIVRNAVANGIPLETVFGGMVASDPDTTYNIYQIQYSGDGSNLPPAFTDQQLEKLKFEYTRIAQAIQTEQGELTHSDLQKLFSETLKKMNFQDVQLFKIEGNSNTVKKVTYNEYGSPSETTCS